MKGQHRVQLTVFDVMDLAHWRTLREKQNDEPSVEILWAKDIFLLSVKVKGDGISVAQIQLQVIASH